MKIGSRVRINNGPFATGAHSKKNAVGTVVGISAAVQPIEVLFDDGFFSGGVQWKSLFQEGELEEIYEESAAE